MTNQILAAVLGFAFIVPNVVFGQSTDWLVPVAVEDRATWKSVQLTHIGAFGLRRRARPGIPSHLHTGIDIKRSRPNYDAEPILPIARGIIISLRDDGPFAQIIIEHRLPSGGPIWTVYEHIAGIVVTVGDAVTADRPIARFMNRGELNRYGWQFDHVHFEVLKVRPRPLAPTAKTPLRLYGTYSLECYRGADLKKYYYNPISFMKALWSGQGCDQDTILHRITIE